MMKKFPLARKLILLALLLIPVVVLATEDSGGGGPCHAERIRYYSDASHTTIVGGDEFICMQGHYVWGQSTPYHTYEYLHACCYTCTDGVCGAEP